MGQTVFDFVANQLESLTEFDELEARGTIRIALREAGLDARTVTSAQMGVVLARVLPDELKLRGVDGAPEICDRIAKATEEYEGSSDDEPRRESPEDVFRRLAR